jgi:ArsR family transcriptional regulator, arsenate/arsenite/antimonite-responsive transcriptional repressor
MKTLEQTRPEERLVAMLRALGNPARFKLFQELRRRNACQCGPLVDVLPLAQSTVSEHLKRLREAGLVRGEIDGPATCYCVDELGLDWLKREIGEL